MKRLEAAKRNKANTFYLIKLENLMWEVEENCIVRMGTNIFINTPNMLAFREEPVFSMKRHEETGYLGIYFEIYNQSGERVASVKRNEIYYGDKDAYRIEGSMNRYTFSERATGKIICDIKKREAAHPAELDVSALLYLPNGFLFNATPDSINLEGTLFHNNVFKDCFGGINVL